jgi:hypothetical protein
MDHLPIVRQQPIQRRGVVLQECLPQLLVRAQDVVPVSSLIREGGSGSRQQS